MKKMSSHQISYAIGCRHGEKKTEIIKKAVEWVANNGHRIAKLESTMFGCKLVTDKQVVNEFKQYLEKIK